MGGKEQAVRGSFRCKQSGRRTGKIFLMFKEEPFY